MSYDLPVRRSQSAGSAFTVATLPTLSQMVGEPIGMLAYTSDSGLYAWNGTTWVSVAANATLALGITPVAGGTPGNILYDNAGFVGELATTGSGNVVLATSPTLVTPVLGAASGTSLSLTSATGLTLNGSVLAKTNTLLFLPLSYYIAPTNTTGIIGSGGTGSISNATWSSGIATLTFTAITTAIPVNTVISVSGMSPSGYNTTYALVTASSTTTISYAVVSNPGAFSSGASAAITGGGNNYTPSSGAVYVEIVAIGGGGGGGGGALCLGTAGNGASGGGGAGAAGWGCYRFRASDISGPITIAVGAGGAGGTAASTITTVGGNGGNGTQTTFGSLFASGGGGFGQGGQLAAGCTGGGSGTGGHLRLNTANGTTGATLGNSGAAATGAFGTNATFAAGGAGGSSNSSGAAFGGGNGYFYQPSGGSAGGGILGGATPTANNGNSQAQFNWNQTATAGNSGTTNGSTQLAFLPYVSGNAGGGGYGAISGTSGNGGAGCNGSGGGGGGSSVNTVGTAGNGGKGGDGLVLVVEYF